MSKEREVGCASTLTSHTQVGTGMIVGEMNQLQRGGTNSGDG